MARLGEIIIGLEELRTRGNGSLWIDTANHWCVTFETRDSTTKGDPFWIQVCAGTLNMQYLDDDDPTARLRAEVADFPREFRQVCWDLAMYATFEMPQAYSSQLPSLIDRIATQYFALQPDYQISHVVEYHGP
jgi:hypothetical protein